MDLLTPEKLRLLLIFVVPGLVIVSVRRQFVVNRRLPLADAIVGYVALSFFYQAAAWPLLVSLLQGSATAAQGLVWVVHLFVGPAALGFVLGLNARAGWTRWLLTKMNVNVGHPVDTAWDWRFSGREECWVMAVLKDGTRWAGHLGVGSFMSTDPAERDIYIEHVYLVDDQNVWTKKGSSVWIAQGELQALEFWPLSKET